MDTRLRAGPVDGLRAFLTLWRDILTSTDFHAGCPVLAVSIEQAPDGEHLTVLAATEGAVALCRAHRSPRPLDHVSNRLESLLTAGGVPGKRGRGQFDSWSKPLPVGDPAEQGREIPIIAACGRGLPTGN